MAGPSAPRYRLRVFGGLSIAGDAGTAPSLGHHRKKLAFLAALAWAGERGVSRDRLLAWFWPESDSDRARNSLNQLAHSVRRELGDDAVVGTNGDLRLNADVVGSDLAEFRAAIDEGVLEKAEAVYAGPLLDGVFLRDVPDFERWLDGARRSLADDYLRALERAVDDAGAAGQHTSAVRWARVLIQHDPLSSSSALRLMRALERSGDMPAAIRYADLHAARVRAELETSADPAVEQEVGRLRARSAAETIGRTLVERSSNPNSGPAGALADETRDQAGGPTPPGSLRHNGDAPRTLTRRPLAIGGALAGGVGLVVLALLARSPKDRIEFGSVRPLVTDPGLDLQPALSPDGRIFAYAAGLAGHLRLYVRSVADGTPIPLDTSLSGQQVSARWSPDGTRILFMSTLSGSDEDSASVYVVPSLGGRARKIVERGGYAAWSPDGLRIAYVHGDSLFTRDVDGEARHTVIGGSVVGMHSLTWSPDGRFIAFVSQNAPFWVGGPLLGNAAPSVLTVVPAAGGEPIALTDRRFMRMSPAWMPDSRRLLFMSNEGGGRDLYSLELDASAHARGTAARLTTGLDIGTFSLSADGTALAYSSFPNASNIRAVDLPASGVATEADAISLTSGAQHIEGLAVSRDGQWLTFDSDRQGGPAIYRMPITGGEGQQITADRSHAFLPAFSPNGAEIAFHSWRTGSRDVYVVPVRGGEEHLVAGGPAQECCVDWSPDGRTIVFHSDRTGRNELWLATRDSAGTWGDARQLTRGGGAQPKWAADGHAIAYVVPGGLSLVSPKTWQSRALVTRLSLDSTEGPPLYIAWSPNSRTVYFKSLSSEGRADIWAVPASGGKPRLIARFGRPNFGSARIEFATDGKRLYFTVEDRESDIKMMDVRITHSR